MRHAGVDRLAALNAAIALVRRGGTISVVGVYGGAADPINMMTLFDKQIQLRMGQANVKRWVPEIMPLLTADDPLGVENFATHRLPLDAAPRRLRNVPEEAGRDGQGGAQTLIYLLLLVSSRPDLAILLTSKKHSSILSGWDQ